MAVFDNKPLSWGEKLILATSLRREASLLLAEAVRIEDGLKADQKLLADLIDERLRTGAIRQPGQPLQPEGLDAHA